MPALPPTRSPIYSTKRAAKSGDVSSDPTEALDQILRRMDAMLDKGTFDRTEIERWMSAINTVAMRGGKLKVRKSPNYPVGTVLTHVLMNVPVIVLRQITPDVFLVETEERKTLRVHRANLMVGEY
jgi:hypothetical protein